MASTPQSRKSKGRRFQKEVKSHILETFPDKLQEDDVRWTSMGASGEDILLSPLAQELVPFAFECKNVERLNVWSSFDQAIENETEDRPALLVYRRNHTFPRANLRFTDFLDLLKENASLKEQIYKNT